MLDITRKPKLRDGEPRGDGGDGGEGSASRSRSARREHRNTGRSTRSSSSAKAYAAHAEEADPQAPNLNRAIGKLIEKPRHSRSAQAALVVLLGAQYLQAQARADPTP
jgi:hypothetical protein